MNDQASTHDSRGSAPAAAGSIFEPSDTFIHRHIGPDGLEIDQMLGRIGVGSLDALVDRAMPSTIRSEQAFDIGSPRSEHAMQQELHSLASRNRLMRSCIGMGYHDTIVPPVIQRNVLESPGWYTQYTPYQAEISQGRLQALLNYQTMISDLTRLPIANASLLDEGTAAAEAMLMCRAITSMNEGVFFVDEQCHPQTIAVLQGRARQQGIELVVADPTTCDPSELSCFGVLLQYPDTRGRIHDHVGLIERIHDHGGLVVMAADLLSLVLIKAPGDLGADIAVGSAQRFGVPMGYGGPHAAYMATRESYVRKMPGRLIGVSVDATGAPALRMSIQTREQHIKRDRATSNICTAQVLLAIMSGFYAVYHGPHGLLRIATRVHSLTTSLAAGLRRLGFDCGDHPFFDTLCIAVDPDRVEDVHAAAVARGYNLRRFDGEGCIGASLDETTTPADVLNILASFNGGADIDFDPFESAENAADDLPVEIARRSAFLEHEVFNTHHSETEMLRYITWLQGRDLSLAQSMIPLGSCTMKLNGTTEMLGVTWPQFGGMHPFAPLDQAEGYLGLMTQLEDWLADLTGFDAVSLQPNAGSQGEYAGLVVIRAYHEQRGDSQRNVCLIPASAHGTNPASAVMAGFEVVPVDCDSGDINLEDLRAKVAAYADRLGAIMVTYPSTHGVFEDSIHEICSLVHDHGGMVYLDGANMNAMVGLSRPADLGADVCHLNLHKTFCIPHGGGGPGMGPIAVRSSLAPFLPGHPVVTPPGTGPDAVEPISAAPWGSPSILPISWMYIALMGASGLKRATQVAILNANYMKHRLQDHYDILFTNEAGFCAHEFIIDCRPFEKSAGLRIDDIAKRLMDYGFHAPTMAWPIPGTLMIEPTESESRDELDRFCDALIAIREEIRAIEDGAADREDNVLRNAPHTMDMIGSDDWSHSYTREDAAWPLPWLRGHKFWTSVARVDNPHGDRNLVCTCLPMDAYGKG
ncbi:MAG: aminomethyl-transferring glycine dehydrogenase [Planctomycetota bacterium]|nr:aminomethyl-transferring glycine dehydrogenase [Planctomycetota bacterium]